MNMSSAPLEPASKALQSGVYDKAAKMLEKYRLPMALFAATVLFTALFSRIMSYPLRHDEHFYLAAAYYLDRADLYSEINFTHVPNFALLLRAVFDVFDVEKVLLAGRLVIALTWAASLYAIYAIARFLNGSREFALLLAALLALNPVLLGPAGMTVTNNFPPTPFALLGILFFLKGNLSETGEPLQCFLAGVFFSLAIGMKANFALLIPAAAIFSLMAPRALPVAKRLIRTTFPLVGGALLAGLPTMYYLVRNPQEFLSHVVRFHGDAHVAFWTVQSDLEGPVALGLKAKLILAQSVWLSGATLLSFLLVAYLAFVRFRKQAENGGRDDLSRQVWPIAFAAILVALALTISFVPTPGFPQYFAPPIAFALVLCAILYGPLAKSAKEAAQPVLAAILLLGSIAAAPVLLPDLPNIIRPAAWTGNSVHRASAYLSSRVGRKNAESHVLTLAPIYAIEGRLTPYDSLLLGPFIYRAVELVNEDDRSYFSAVQSPELLEDLLARDMPSAVLIGTEPYLDVKLERWALANGYTPEAVELGDKRKGSGTLYLRP